jgi:hypothetical protein
MTGDITVTITWMDDQPTIQIDCYDVREANGTLHMVMRVHSGKPDRHIPLAHVREYTVRQQ